MMVAPTRTSRKLIPGTTGWSVSDLEDPALRRQWDAGRYEIVYGVLATMPAAFFDHGAPLQYLSYVLQEYFSSRKQQAALSTEVDVVIGLDTVFVADLVLMTQADLERQRAQARPADAAAGRVGRLVVPPTLVVESLSEGHEDHDARFKRQQYAAFGVPNYWLVSYMDRSLTCLTLAGDAYEEDTPARQGQLVMPTAFPGLTIDLDRLFV